MQDRSRNKKNVNRVAHSLIEAIAEGNVPLVTPDGKNAFAAALGRRGGLKGGPARAAAMTDKQRSESARKAAEARWKRS